MNLWLKKQQPVILRQSSDLPYISFEDGIFLCYDNCYSTSYEKNQYAIEFVYAKKKIQRINTYFYKIKKFPILLDWSSVKLTTGFDQHTEQTNDLESATVFVIKSSRIKKMSQKSVEKLIDEMNEFDYKFIITASDKIDDNTRSLEDSCAIIEHNSWHKTITSILNNICQSESRNINWTKQIQPLSMFFYNIDNTEEIDNMQQIIDDLRVECFINWL